MTPRMMLCLAVATIAALWGRTAAAQPSFDYLSPATWKVERIDVHVVGDEIWSTDIDFQGAHSIAAEQQYVWDESAGELIVPVDVNMKCPDFDETLVNVKVSDGHSTIGPFDTGKSARVAKRAVLATREQLVDACGKTMHAQVEVNAACDPAVGKPDGRRHNWGIPIHVSCDAKKIPSRVSVHRWLHACPAGYEVDDASPKGEGTQTAALWHSSPTQCRKAGKKLAKKPAAKKQQAQDKYQEALALAGDARDILNLAGYRTVYELANAPLAHLTSVLGISAGKKVRAAAKAAVSSQSILDPNWAFDEIFLLRPSWVVNPRLRTTKGALTKLQQAHDELWKLQKRGITTLHHLAEADPDTVNGFVGGEPGRGALLVQRAGLATAWNGNEADLAIARDWVIHAAWMVDPGFFPSGRVVRRAKQKLDGKPTASAHTPTSPATVTAGSNAKPKPPGTVVVGRDLPGINPAGPLKSGSSKRRRTPGTPSKKDRVRGKGSTKPRGSGSSRGRGSPPPRGEGGRGRNEGKSRGRGRRSDSPPPRGEGGRGRNEGKPRGRGRRSESPPPRGDGGQGRNEGR